MRPVLLALAIAVLLAPAGALAAAEGPQQTPDPRIADGSAKAALTLARERWAGAQITSYSFQVRRSCFCPPTGFRTMVVVHGIPRAPAAELKDVATVPRLFKRIRAAIDSGAARLTVTYGPHGVPKSIAIDPSAQIADEETSFTTRRFKPR